MNEFGARRTKLASVALSNKTGMAANTPLAPSCINSMNIISGPTLPGFATNICEGNVQFFFGCDENGFVTLTSNNGGVSISLVAYDYDLGVAIYDIVFADHVISSFGGGSCRVTCTFEYP